MRNFDELFKSLKKNSITKTEHFFSTNCEKLFTVEHYLQLEKETVAVFENLTLYELGLAISPF